MHVSSQSYSGPSQEEAPSGSHVTDLPGAEGEILAAWAMPRLEERHNQSVDDVQRIFDVLAGTRRDKVEANAALFATVSKLLLKSGVGLQYQGYTVSLAFSGTSSTGYFVLRKGPNKNDVLYREAEFPSEVRCIGKHPEELGTSQMPPSGDLVAETIGADLVVELRRVLSHAAELMDAAPSLVPEVLPDVAALMERVCKSPDVVTRKPAAEILNRSPGRVTQLADEGRLPSFTMMGEKVYRRSDVEKEALNERIPGPRRREN